MKCTYHYIVLVLLFEFVFLIHSQAQIVVNNGSDVVLNGASSFVVNGTDIETLTDGTIHDNSAANVYFEGTVNTEILGAALALHNITVNNTAHVTLQTPLTINTNTTFQNGNVISASSKEIIFSDNATYTGATSTSHIHGPAQKIGDDDFDFPLGNGTLYAPIGISGLSASDTYTAQFFYVNPTTAGYDITSKDVGINNVSSVEYWMLSRSGAIDAFVTLYWNSSHHGGITDMADMLLCHWNTVPNPDIWQSIVGTTAGDVNAGSIRSNAKVSSFSPFTLGSSSADNPLPITLSSFNAKQVNNSILVEWETESEINNAEIILEKSSDGINFIPIAFRKGAGNSTQKILYENTDFEPTSMNYYRLIQIDYDGKSSVSKIIVIPFSNQKSIVYKVLHKSIIIENLDVNKIYGVLVTNEIGEKVYIKMFNSLQNSTFTIPYNFKNGAWIVTIFENNTHVTSQKFIFD